MQDKTKKTVIEYLERTDRDLQGFLELLAKGEDGDSLGKLFELLLDLAQDVRDVIDTARKL